MGIPIEYRKGGEILLHTTPGGGKAGNWLSMSEGIPLLSWQ